MPSRNNKRLDIERIIRESELEVKTRILERVPEGCFREIVPLLGSVVKVVPHGERIRGRWMITELVGYIGKSEFSDDLRHIWSLELSRPLPAHHLGVRDYDEVLILSIYGVNHLFNKIDGSYLGGDPARTA